jgi:hypothetical protein
MASCVQAVYEAHRIAAEEAARRHENNEYRRQQAAAERERDALADKLCRAKQLLELAKAEHEGRAQRAQHLAKVPHVLGRFSSFAHRRDMGTRVLDCGT